MTRVRRLTLAQRRVIRDRRYRTLYGISLADYDRMFKAQGGRCAICHRRSRKNLAVDHSHITGTVRGLLCSRCNRDVVGPIDGNVQYINEAIDFLLNMKEDLISKKE